MEVLPPNQIQTTKLKTNPNPTPHNIFFIKLFTYGSTRGCNEGMSNLDGGL